MNTKKQQHPFVKICGITHQSVADNASAGGAAMLGFIFHPRSPRGVSAQRAAKINTTSAKRVGVFVQQNAEEICDIMRQAKLDFAQLHGKQSTSDAQRIGKERVIRVIWPDKYTDHASLQAEIDQWANSCAYYLLDAGTQGGGHGKGIDLSKLEGLHFPQDWILAGGINAELIPSIMETCQPNGLDLNSKLEFAAGHKSNRLILKTFKSLHYSAS